MISMDYRHDKMERPRVPGVHLEEVAWHSEASFRTGVPLFVGFVKAVPQVGFDEVERDRGCLVLNRWEEFSERVGPPLKGSYLGYAVRGFFENGGERCLVFPIEISTAEPDCLALFEAVRRFFDKDVFDFKEIVRNLEMADLVCVPDIMMEPIRHFPEVVADLQRRVLEYCLAAGDRFAILDAIRIGDGRLPHSQSSDYAQGVLEQRKRLLVAEGALYCPWIRVLPILENPLDWVPPCGHVAGIFARTDGEIGVHKAPANEVVEGVVDLELTLTTDDQIRLNDEGVNCLRSFTRRGIRVWGARTLSGFPQWRYVNVRRVFLTLVRWIEGHMNDLVFEPNNAELWERLRGRLGEYCYEMYRRGALKGRSPEEAYFIKCDGELNTFEVREVGQVVCEVGLAPLSPAEFIVIRITQNPSGSVAVSQV